MEYQIEVNTNKCKGCFYCVKFCPSNKLVATNELNQKGYPIVRIAEDARCSGCNNCILMCSEGCISIFKEVKETIQGMAE